MGKHTAPNQPVQECFACGARRPERDMVPFGYYGDRVASWVCGRCTSDVSTPAPTAPRRDDTAVLA